MIPAVPTRVAIGVAGMGEATGAGAVETAEVIGVVAIGEVEATMEAAGKSLIGSVRPRQVT
jgi:hypothetical protein